MKTCFCCQQSKPLSEYYKHPQMGDGHLNKCKECVKKYAIKHRLANHEYLLRYDRQRAMLPHRKASREKYWEMHPGKAGSHAKQWSSLNPKKRAAQLKMARAIRSGRLVRLPCVKCGNPKSQGHHEDYSKPLDVIWLCTKHHAERHKELRGTLEITPFVFKQGPYNATQWPTLTIKNAAK